MLQTDECVAVGDPAFRADVIAGLGRPQKSIPPRWFYDETGSNLFEQITRLPEYYCTRVETAILTEAVPQLARMLPAGLSVVEFGSGSSTKTPLLLRAANPAAYVPIDISGDFLRQSAHALAQAHPGLAVWPVEADFLQPLTLPDSIAGTRKLGFFPGSTIGNFSPRVAVDLLRTIGQTLGSDAMLLIGIDRIKPRERLLAAYDDGAGVTAAFNLNLLHRINRELDGDIPVAAFRHQARWDDRRARIEMHLEATRDVAFRVAGHTVSLVSGETIHTENSHKYDRRGARQLLAAGGWLPVGEWSDPAEDFLVILAETDPDTVFETALDVV